VVLAQAKGPRGKLFSSLQAKKSFGLLTLRRKQGTPPSCKPCKGGGFVEVPAKEVSRDDAARDWDGDNESGYSLVAGEFDEEMRL
jgi:hypothetical protein